MAPDKQREERSQETEAIREKRNGQHHARMATPPGAGKAEPGASRLKTDDNAAKQEPAQSSKSVTDKIKRAIMPPEWVLNNYKNVKVCLWGLAFRAIASGGEGNADAGPQNWKIVLRCAIASWAGLILILVYPTEQMLGNAAL